MFLNFYDVLLGFFACIILPLIVLSVHFTNKDPAPRVDYVPPRSVEQYCASATLPKVCDEYLTNYFNGVYAP